MRKALIEDGAWRPAFRFPSRAGTRNRGTPPVTRSIESIMKIRRILPPASILFAALVVVPTADLLAYNPSNSVRMVEWESMARASAPFIRVGFAAPKMIQMADRDLKRYYNESWGLMADCFFYRRRSRRGNGFDIGARFMYRDFTIGRDVLEKEEKLVNESNRLHLMSWDLIIRAVIGVQFLHVLWQFYVIGAPRLLHYHSVLKENRQGGPDRRIDLVSIGVIGGAGIEVAPVPMLAIFAEYNIGYTPVGVSHNNVEGHQVYVGFSWRVLGRTAPIIL